MIWAAGLAALLTLMNSVIAWRLSARYQCASVADIFWPLHHLVSITTVLLLMPQNLSTASLMALILVMLWGVRLTTHLSLRQAGVEEDPRYQAIRASIGADFDRKSLKKHNEVSNSRAKTKTQSLHLRKTWRRGVRHPWTQPSTRLPR